MIGAPIIRPAFTYDQQSEPTGTLVAGQTWRERSGGGLIVAEWEWSGSLWWGRLQDSGSLSVSNISTASSGPTFTGSVDLNPGQSVYFELNIRYYVATADGANNWTITLRRSAEQVAGTVGAAQIANPVMLTIDTGLASWREVTATRVLTVATFRELINSATITRIGTPSNLSATLFLRYRRIR